MTRAHKVLGVLLVVVATILGCAKAPVPSPTTAASEARPANTAALEARVQKLEDEVRTLAAARDAAARKLAAAEQRAAGLEQQLAEAREAAAREKAALAAERDDLRGTVKARTAERDALQAQFVAYLDEQADRIARQKQAVLSQLPYPTVSTSPTPAPAALQN